MASVISLSAFNWGRGNSDLTIGGCYVHSDVHQRWLALGHAISAPSVWPKPSDFPEGDMMSSLYTWAAMEQEITAACYCANLSQPDTHNEQALNKDRFIGKFAPEAWPPQRILQSILVKKWPQLTVPDCVGKDGQPLAVSQIASGRP